VKTFWSNLLIYNERASQKPANPRRRAKVAKVGYDGGGGDRASGGPRV
jgi:hypothetical protein